MSHFRYLRCNVFSINQWRGKKKKATKNKLYYETKKKGGKAQSIQPTVSENISQTDLRQEAPQCDETRFSTIQPSIDVRA